MSNNIPKTELLNREIHEKWSTIVFILSMAFITCLYVVKAHFGMYSDETYQINFGKLILDGRMPITEIWNIQSFSGYIQAITIWLYGNIHGSYEGLVLITRYVYILLHLIVGLFAFSSFKKVYGEIQAQLATVIVMLSIFTFMQSYYRSLLFLFLLSSICFILRADMQNSRICMCGGAICFACTVLVYPSCILLIIPIICYFVKNKNVKHAITFFATCIILAGMLLVLYLMQNAPGDLINYAMLSLKREFATFFSIRRYIECLLVIISMIASVLFCNYMLKKDGTKIFNIFVLLLLVPAYFYRFSTAGGNRILYVCFAVFVLQLWNFMHLEYDNKQFILLCLIYPALLLFFIMQITSSDGISQSTWSAVLGWIALALTVDPNLPFEKNYKMHTALLLIAMLLSMHCIYNGELEPSNMKLISHGRELVEHGIYKGIYVCDSKDELEEIDEIMNKYVLQDDIVTVLSGLNSNAAYLTVDAIESNYASYGVFPFSDRYLKYYESYPETIPTIYLINIDYMGGNQKYEQWLNSSELGTFVRDNYNVENAEKYKQWVIIR